jgi:hypothetical protein
MFDWRASADCPLPKGKRVAVFTNAGGGLIAMMRWFQWFGARDWMRPTQDAGFIAEAASVRNPRYACSASPMIYAGCLRTLLEGSVDQVLLILSAHVPC